MISPRNDDGSLPSEGAPFSILLYIFVAIGDTGFKLVAKYVCGVLDVGLSQGSTRVLLEWVAKTWDWPRLIPSYRAIATFLLWTCLPASTATIITDSVYTNK